MAERRMFAKSIIGSGRFLQMPATSRLLYYDLGMEADDDGVVEALRVMRATGATEDDLRILHAKGFVQILNTELVSLICDWKVNNLVRQDRYHQSIYARLLGEGTSENTVPSVVPEVSIVSGTVILIPLIGDAEFAVTQEMVAEWQSLYPGIDVMQELRNIRGWCLANPANRKTQKGVKRFINGWLSRDQNRARPNRTAPGTETRDDFTAFMDAAARGEG